MMFHVQIILIRKGQFAAPIQAYRTRLVYVSPSGVSTSYPLEWISSITLLKSEMIISVVSFTFSSAQPCWWSCGGWCPCWKWQTWHSWFWWLWRYKFAWGFSDFSLSLCSASTSSHTWLHLQLLSFFLVALSSSTIASAFFAPALTAALRGSHALSHVYVCAPSFTIDLRKRSMQQQCTAWILRCLEISSAKHSLFSYKLLGIKQKASSFILNIPEMASILVPNRVHFSLWEPMSRVYMFYITFGILVLPSFTRMAHRMQHFSYNILGI